MTGRDDHPASIYAEAVGDDLRAYVVHHLADPGAVLVVERDW